MKVFGFLDKGQEFGGDRGRIDGKNTRETRETIGTAVTRGTIRTRETADTTETADTIDIINVGEGSDTL